MPLDKRAQERAGNGREAPVRLTSALQCCWIRGVGGGGRGLLGGLDPTMNPCRSPHLLCLGNDLDHFNQLQIPQARRFGSLGFAEESARLGVATTQLLAAKLALGTDSAVLHN